MNDYVQTDEVIENALVPNHNLSQDVFNNIAQRPVTDEQAVILLGKTNPDDLDILPTGEIYLTQSKYRQRLNQAFGPAGWAMRPLSPPYIKDDLAMQEWALYATGGQFIAYAVGGAKYQESNQRMKWDDTLETVKSNALMRLCKDLGIASECWDKRFAAKFKAKYCVKVWVEKKNRPQWRRLDAEPFYQETRIAQSEQPKPEQATVSEPKPQPAQATDKPYKFPNIASKEFYDRVQLATDNYYKNPWHLLKVLGGTWFNFANQDLYDEKMDLAVSHAREKTVVIAEEQAKQDVQTG